MRNSRNNFTCYNHKKICSMAFKNVELSVPLSLCFLKKVFTPIFPRSYRSPLLEKVAVWTFLASFYLALILKFFEGSPRIPANSRNSKCYSFPSNLGIQKPRVKPKVNIRKSFLTNSYPSTIRVASQRSKTASST